MGANTDRAERIRSVRDLRAYTVAETAAVELYEHSKAFPRDELYSLTSQVRRCSRSVCANLAEAWQKRRYPAAFTAKLTDSAAEAEETRVWISFADRCGFLDPDVARELAERYNRIVAMIVQMANRPEEWRTR